MAEITHYDKDGKKTGYSSDTDSSGIIFIIFIGLLFALVWAINWIVNKVSQWESLETPYNYIGAFYYYIVVIPFDNIAELFKWIHEYKLTQYPNLNIVLIITIAILMLVISFMALKYMARFLKSIGCRFLHLFALLLAPALLGGAWFIIVETFNWLTAVS
jgi:hypothetical protein